MNETLIVAREYALKHLFGTWELCQSRIESLMKTTKESGALEKNFIHIETAYHNLDSIITRVASSNFSKNEDESRESEARIFSENIGKIKIIFHNMFKAYLKTSTGRDEAIYPGDSLKDMKKKFDRKNLRIRLPHIHDDATLFENQDILNQCYWGVFSLIQGVRNYDEHREEVTSSSFLDDVGRTVEDPATGAKSPGGVLVLASILVLVIYQFIEILQTYEDTINHVSSQKVKK